MREEGLLLKGVGGFYTIRTPQGEDVVAKARGKFRLDGVTPVCGDRVLFERQQEGDAAMVDILPRSNVLRRPPVANIDQLVIVLAASAPKPDLLLCDKLMLAASMHGIEPIIVFNKMDTVDDDGIDALSGEYRAQYTTLTVSARTGQGMDALSDMLSHKTSCLAGQSAVGKSSLINQLMPALMLPVGVLARRTDRGRHTTRHVELWPYRGGAVLDTPGFSLLELQEMEQEALNQAYREFGDAPQQCKFAACAHRSEPDCAVKALIGGRLAHGRYERYVLLSQQIEEMRRTRYE